MSNLAVAGHFGSDIRFSALEETQVDRRAGRDRCSTSVF